MGADRVVLDLPVPLLLLLQGVIPLSCVAAYYVGRQATTWLGKRSTEWISGPKYFQEHETPTRRRDWRTWSLSILALGQSAGALTLFALAVQHRAAGIAWRLALVALLYLLTTVRPIARPAVTVPYVLFNLYLLQVVFGLLWIIKLVAHHSSELQRVLVGLYIASTMIQIGVTMTYRMELPIVRQGDEKNPSPEDTVVFASWIVFNWVKPLINRGERLKLGHDDVWDLSTPMKSDNVHREAQEINGGLIWKVYWLNRLDMTLSLSLGLVDAGLSYLSPYFLNQILSSLSANATAAERTSAYVYTTLALLAGFLRAELILQQLWHERRAIVRTRSWLVADVYYKALKRRDTSALIAAQEEKPSKDKDKGGKKSDKAAASASAGSTGRTVQLMSNDAQRVALQLMSLSSTVSAPFELLIAVFFLYQLLGWTAFAGLVVMAVVLPFNNYLVRRRVRIHRSLLASRDRRMDIMNEFIQAIRFVKYSAAESQWLKRVDDVREEELGWLLKTRLNTMLISAIWTYTPDFVMLVAFALFVGVRHQQLTVPIAFTSVALFNLLRGPMSILPNAITQLLQTYVSIQRLETFFNEPEVEDWVSAFSENGTRASGGKVKIIEGHFTYKDAPAVTVAENAPKVQTVDMPAVAAPAVTHSGPPTDVTNEVPAATVVNGQSDIPHEPPTFELRDISVDFPNGKLTVVTGPTSAGKSSLFAALLGEMYRVSGTVELPKHPMTAVRDDGLYDGVALCAQLPWLQHASIRDNILFGSPYEQSRYEAVLDACALRPDLALFDAGDQTEIGEKGISLSGGQKARVALARACYSRARVVLLDDPLSAVDSHTAHHIFHECIRGPQLAGRTVILITHHISLTLPKADFVVELASGRISFQGPADEYKQLRGISQPSNAPPSPESETTVEEVLDTDASKKKTEEAEATGRVKNDGKLIDEEQRATGKVKWSVYRAYLTAAGWDSWVMIIALILIGRAFLVLDRWWFKVWGESYGTASKLLSAARSQVSLLFQLTSEREPLAHAQSLVKLPPASEDVRPYVAVYALIGLGNLAVFMLGTLAGFRGSFKAARSLFRKTVKCVVRASFRYFDTTPTGRILNRYSADFGVIDMSITEEVRSCLARAFSFLVNMGVIVVVSPAFIPPAIVIIYFYVRLSLSYVRSSRDLRRLESTSRSPIFSKFGETLAGVVTCRAFGAERRFLKQLYQQVDTYLAAHYTGAVVSRYTLFRFELLGATGVAITTFSTLIARASPGLAALAITSAQLLVQNVYWLARFVTQLEVDLNAVERVTELLELPQEPAEMIESKRPPAYWPSDRGGIDFDNVSIAYAPTLPAVLRGVTFRIEPGQKIGLVGRTGSGKSSLAMSLFRFVDPLEGQIIIDGIDITSIGTEDLRSRLTLIPQEAVLFSGTVRSNLDPFDQHTDEECLEALARVHLAVSHSQQASRIQSRSASPAPVNRNLDAAKGGDDSSSSAGSTVVDTLNGRTSVSLSSPVSQGGNNFSAGQRQLLALARALLRSSTRILVMDEATASIDFETDEKIQRTIQEEFADTLVICIAHRLLTVARYDKILVLDAGVIVEYDSPKNLLNKPGSAFRKMCEQAADWDAIRAVVLGSSSFSSSS